MLSSNTCRRILLLFCKSICTQEIYTYQREQAYAKVHLNFAHYASRRVTLCTDQSLGAFHKSNRMEKAWQQLLERVAKHRNVLAHTHSRTKIAHALSCVGRRYGEPTGQIFVRLPCIDLHGPHSDGHVCIGNRCNAALGSGVALRPMLAFVWMWFLHRCAQQCDLSRPQNIPSRWGGCCPHSSAKCVHVKLPDSHSDIGFGKPHA